MNPLIELNLALILFLPWFAILGVLFWMFPRQPRNAHRKLFDGVALLLAFTAFLLSLYWSDATAVARICCHIFPYPGSAVGYGVFLAVLTVAFFLRRRWLRRHP